ncbi:aminotransferase class IV [Actinoplanes regularis]|uniref:aminotransferase class IV n=1 Tax=Actinoplanes regularis TaxID=52697 RepID=UPI002556BFA6|nr:aminotransferase class IV [Actinoplanes regularis]
MIRVEINGEPATVEAVHRAATWNYGHYTSMQVRDGAVAGLPLHLRRLSESSAVLFPAAAPPSGDRVRTLVDHALGDLDDATVQVTVLPDPASRAGTDIMVSVSEPVEDAARSPLRVRTVQYERELPELKHLATLGLAYHRLRAREAGFDDALLTAPDGSLREGSAWNIAFWDGAQVVWPEGPLLAGITMQVLRLGLRRLGVPDTTRRVTRDSLDRMTGAAATNSHCPAQPIAAIDETLLPEDQGFTDLLRRAWQQAEWEPIAPTGQGVARHPYRSRRKP